MQYELRNVEIVSNPKDTDNPKEAMFFINVTTGIVGDAYGFAKIDTTSYRFDRSLSGDEINALAKKAGADYVSTNYPDTK